LRAGQHVITGAFFRCDLAEPGAYTARFADIGEVTLNIG
jgi:2-keto-4-pentenoate hydratase